MVTVEGSGNRCNVASYKLLGGTVVQVQVQMQVENIVQLLWLLWLVVWRSG